MDLAPILAWFAPGPMSAVAAAVGALALWCWRSGQPAAAMTAAIFAAFGAAAAAAPAVTNQVEALVAHAQARAQTQAPAATDLLKATEDRHARHMAAAQGLADGAPARLVAGFAQLGSDTFPGAARFPTSPPQKTGVVYVAVSFAMPPADLRRLAREAQAAGAVAVVRGLVRGSFQETLKAARQVFDEGSLGGVSIDPNVFRAFDVRATPTFIAATGPVQPCARGLDCIPPAPPHDQLRGNISLRAALGRLAADGENAPDVAAAAVQRLGE